MDPNWRLLLSLTNLFTGPIAAGLTLIAMVSSALMLEFAKSESHRTFAAIVFSVSMAVVAVYFVCVMPGPMLIGR